MSAEMNQAQLFYLVLLPSGPDPELPEGSCFTLAPGEGRTHWEVIHNVESESSPLQDMSREMFVQRLSESFSRRYLLSAVGPVDRVFGDAPAALAAVLGSASDGWVNDLISGRLLSRDYALSLSGMPNPEEHVYLAGYEPGLGMLTRGLLKLGHPELAIRHGGLSLRRAAKAALLALGKEIAASGRPFEEAEPRSLNDVQVRCSSPPGIHTAKIDSAPSGAHEHHLHWVEQVLQGTEFETGGVLMVNFEDEAGHDISEEFLGREHETLPEIFEEADAEGHETPIQALASVLGSPDQVSQVSSPEAEGLEVHILKFAGKLAQRDGGEPRDLYVTAGLSDRPTVVGVSSPVRVELGVITPDGEADWLPQLLLGLRHAVMNQPTDESPFAPETTVAANLGQPELDCFGGLLFMPPIFMPPEDAVLSVTPVDADPYSLVVLLSVPLTTAEVEFKMEKGYEALIGLLEEQFPDGSWLVAAPRESAV